MHGIEPLSGDGADEIDFAALDRALGEHVEGWRPLDGPIVVRDGAHAGRTVADRAGIDRDGRIVVVRVLVDEAREPLGPLHAALAWTRNSARRLAHSHAAADREREPLLVIVAVGASDALRDALDVLRAADVAAFELREMNARAGRDAWLVPIGSARPLAAEPPLTVDAWLETLERSARVLASSLLARIARVDPEIQVVARRRGLEWSLDGRGLLEVGLDRARLAAHSGADVVVLASEADVESALDLALDRYLAATASETGPELAPSLLPTGPLLSAEELAAFSD